MTLPPSLRRFFWDQDFDRLRWPEDCEPIARRLLSAGDGAALAWLRKEVGDGWLRDRIRATRGRELDARRLRYVHALATKFRPIRDLLGFYRSKHGVADVTHVLYGLPYFDDAEPEQMPDMLAPADWEAIKREVRAWVKALA